MALLNPLTDDLVEWADAAAFATTEYGIEGPVLVGMHIEEERVLLGVSKRYGYPGTKRSPRRHRRGRSISRLKASIETFAIPLLWGVSEDLV